MTAADSRYRFSRSQHLTDLIAEAQRLAGLVAGTPAVDRARLAEARLLDAAKATLVLDGVPDDEVPDLAAAVTAVGPAPSAETASTHETDTTAGTDKSAGTGSAGTWLDALRVLDHPSGAVMRAGELVGARAGLSASDLAEPLSSDLNATLAELHRRLTRGLVAGTGVARTTDQAVVDASTGRVIYFLTDPATIPHELALLGSWLAETGPREHVLVASGVLHLELLRVHPFEVANGRLARTAATLLLRARGLDPDGLATPEVSLARDALGYHEEVARTARRRDLTIWLERWGEAVTDGLRSAAREMSAVTTRPRGRAERFVAAQDGADFTVADYHAGALVTPEDARVDLQLLLDAGRISRIPGTGGLRLRSAPD